MARIARTKRKYFTKIHEDAIIQYELGPGDAPTGWVIKGFKSPQLPGVINSSSSGGKVKEGLIIHREVSKMLKILEVKNKWPS